MDELKTIKYYYEHNIQLPPNQEIVFTENVNEYDYLSFKNFKFFVNQFRFQHGQMPNVFVINKDNILSIREWIHERELKDSVYFEKTFHYATITGIKLFAVDFMRKDQVMVAYIEEKGWQLVATYQALCREYV